MDGNAVVQDTVSQGEAAWVGYLNQVRLETLIKELEQQNKNFTEAIDQLNELKTIVNFIIESDRGGIKGIHGFLAEATETYAGNAESLVEGNGFIYEWINDNGPVDFLKNGVDMQQKFVQNGGHFSLNAVKEHLDKYPDFIKNGGKYQIPKDFYDKIITIMNMTDEEVQKLASSGDGITRAQAEWVRRFFDESGISLEDLEPSNFNYADIQKGRVQDTIDKEEGKVKKKNKEQKDKAYQKSKPSLKEGAKATAIGAALEGGTAFCLGVYKKIKSGKSISEFNEEDWIDLGIDTGKGAAKGGIRGAVVYGMTNFTATSSSVASSFVTASFGMLSQAQKLREGVIDEEEFIVNSQVVCLDAAVSAVSATIGQIAIPIPVLGALVGNAVGEFMYGIAKDSLNKNEQLIIQSAISENNELTSKLESKYNAYVMKLRHGFEAFETMSAFAFDYEVNDCFQQEYLRFFGSNLLCENAGVAKEKVLKEKKDIDNYFLN